MRSDLMKQGPSRAPHRSLLNALGVTESEQKRPFIAVVSSKNGFIPGHVHLDTITRAVEDGIRNAGGVPFTFYTIGVCDGLAMNHTGMKYSLCSRELIADSIEVMLTAHPIDAVVFIPNCDKIVPGMLLAACRMNLPSIFVSGGPMLPGKHKGVRMGLSEMFEAVGSHAAGKIDDHELACLEEDACPTCGSCSGMYTANSMNCLTEVLGMGLRGNGTIPAVYSARIELAKHAGMQVMELVRKGIRPRDIMTPAAIRNALTADMALGCSTNSMLHLPAIANECGVDFNLDMANEISAVTPNLCHLAPAGPTYMEDLNAAGGVYAVLKELTKKHLLDTSVLTVTGFGHSQVERVVHVSLVHLGDEQTHRAHHDDSVRRLDAYHYVVELFLLADAQKLHAALDDAFRRVAVARHDAVGERTVVHADAHRCVVFAANIEEGHEAVFQFLEFVGILRVGILNLLEHARRVYVVARVYAHLLCVQRSHVSHVGVEVNVGNERCGVAVGTQLCVYVLQVLSLSATLRSESHEFAACLYDALSLSHARLRVVGVGCGHRLHAYRGVAAKLYVAYLNG